VLIHKTHGSEFSPRRVERLRGLAKIALLVAALALCLMPRGAWAISLPDARTYELVSPTEKNGNQAGVVPGEGLPEAGYTVASANGDSLLYTNSGPFGGTTSAVDVRSVARRTAIGWASSGVLPLQQGQPTFPGDQLHGVLPSDDLSHILFSVFASFASGDPDTGHYKSPGVYLAGQEGRPVWVSEPTISNPDPPLGQVDVNESPGPFIAGGSPDLSSVYFTFWQTLVPEDQTRAEHVDSQESGKGSPWGFYEWHDGKLTNAGELPSGSLEGPFDPWGAVPAATGGVGSEGANPESVANQVSSTGLVAFFVSPDPAWSTATNTEHCEALQKKQEQKEKEQNIEAHLRVCAEGPPELYVRESEDEGADTKSRTLLVSKSELAGHEGEPSRQGPMEVPPPAIGNSTIHAHYVYVSPDGSKAIFESRDKLATSAQGEEVTGTGPWAYEFNLRENKLTYLPGVTNNEGGISPVLASAADGSRFIFVKEKEDASHNQIPSELDLWSAGNVQSVQRIAELPAAGNVSPVRATKDGSVFVFETDLPPSGATNADATGPANNNGGFQQVYRYDVISHALSCVSCPPVGVGPSGNANLSSDDGLNGVSQSIEVDGTVTATRGVSDDGTRVFFDTPSALVPQDVNGRRDVYEWENGHVYLLSSGMSPEDSFFLDNSESGNDVFFATLDGLVTEDTDGAFDIYDARVDGGFPASTVSTGCSGEACQGQPGAPGLPVLVSSVTDASGNLAAPPAPLSTPPSGSPGNARSLARALRVCRAKRSKRKRVVCERQAHKRYGALNAKKSSRRAR